MKRNKRTPLLEYWTTRYLITLCIGLIVIGVISTLWIRYNAVQKRLDSLKALAEEIAESAVESSGNFRIDPFLTRDIERRQRFLGLGPELILFIVDSEGRLLYGRPPILPVELFKDTTISPDTRQSVRQITTKPGQKVYLIQQAIISDERTVGSVFIIYPVREINRSPEEIQLLIFMLGGLALLGWLIIYSLTKKLAKPIKDVADAANQIVTGNYDIELDKNVKEQEIFELISSFKEMAERLRQLEAIRTELLAGVTHELKTPVTSISGLIQAVKDEVVTGEEAKEFLGICAKETAKLQHMVEDLLNFNYFAAGDIKVNKEVHNINELVQEISYQWLLGQEEDKVVLQTWLPDKTLTAATDALRLQQILYNLFNNAKQAMIDNGQIDVFLYEQDEEIRIDVKDNGRGIPAEEQELIFERFFRGKEKKDKVRGLGLGLSFSKMMARALGGDLVLKNSSLEGTTFTLILKD